MDGWMDGQMIGWMDAYGHGWMDAWMDGWKGKMIAYIHHKLIRYKAKQEVCTGSKANSSTGRNNSNHAELKRKPDKK
jgi:hypothetical protein